MEVTALHVESSGTIEPRNSISKERQMVNVEMYAAEYKLKNKQMTNEDTDQVQLLDRGLMQIGCPHSRRRCRIRAPCCNEIFDCRHCHNEAKNHIDVDQKERHDMPCHQVQQVICSLCGFEQEVRQVCNNCGVCMGKYLCETCKLHLRTSIIAMAVEYAELADENIFHCYKCGCCYSILLKNNHPCVEGAMHHDCPVCFEYLFESRNDVTVMLCGHTIHQNCLKEMQDASHYILLLFSASFLYFSPKYACPLCSKSVCDMSKSGDDGKARDFFERTPDKDL
ncbi:Zinc finger, CHY-type, partial [Dillenia turbinata]